MKLSSWNFSSQEDYVHHTRAQFQKSSLEGDIWLIAYFVNDISNSDDHWIVHDKDPKSFEEAIEIVLCYQRTSKKNHNKPKALGTKQSQFAWKHKTPNEFLDHDYKRQNPFACSAKRRVTQKSNVGSSNAKSTTTKTKL